MPWMDELRADLRFAFRYFARNKATTVIIVLVLALGISANTILFSVMQAQILYPAPAVPDDDRLTRIWATQRDRPTAKWNERNVSGRELQACC